MSEFIAQRIERESSIRLNAEIDIVFPLFSAAGERDWVEGWDPEYVYPISGKLEKDSIFLTRHQPGSDPVVWVAVEYEPQNYFVRFLRVHANDHVADISVRCTIGDHETTRASIRYVFTGLSDEGNSSISVHTEEHFKQWIDSWAEAINRFLHTNIGVNTKTS